MHKSVNKDPVLPCEREERGSESGRQGEREKVGDREKGDGVGHRVKWREREKN